MEYRSRISRLADWLAAERTSAALFVDVEGRRDPAIRYFTGHPGDALLFVFSDARSLLVPWDINLARSIATADEMVAYSEYNRSLTQAVEAIVKKGGITGPVEVSASTPHPVFEELRTASGRAEIVCRTGGLDEVVTGYRMVKDTDEIRLLVQAAEVTNELLSLLQDFLANSTDPAEVDVALFLEREALRRGCQGMSFESLVAGPSRSFGIHAFPPYSAAPFAREGMSILDFGVLVDGYPSDVTVTVVKGTPSDKQEEMIGLVQRAYDTAVAKSTVGTATREIAAAVDELFESGGYSMPHSLGHGLGLEVHEKPFLRNKPDIQTRLEPGMAFTIEPGLYDSEAGGVRLENDLLVGDQGTRILTTSRILRLP